MTPRHDKELWGSRSWSHLGLEELRLGVGLGFSVYRLGVGLVLKFHHITAS